MSLTILYGKETTLRETPCQTTALAGLVDNQCDSEAVGVCGPEGVREARKRDGSKCHHTQANYHNFKFHVRQGLSNPGITWGSLKTLTDPSSHTSFRFDRYRFHQGIWTFKSPQVIPMCGSHNQEALLLLAYWDDLWMSFSHQNVLCQCCLTLVIRKT